MVFHIAIDGPAGSGKSTIAKKLAKKLHFEYIDSGALYRAFGLLAKEKNTNLANKKELKELFNFFDVLWNDGRIILNGKDVSEEIRTSEAGIWASKVAKIPEVRDVITKKLREISRNKNVVMDGRDIGTVVLPDAQIKIFLTASIEERAKRRYKELIEKGEKVSLEKIMEDIRKRDENDTKRSVAPLKPAEDAIIVDTTAKSIDEVLEEIMKIVKSRLNLNE